MTRSYQVRQNSKIRPCQEKQMEHSKRTATCGLGFRPSSVVALQRSFFHRGQHAQINSVDVSGIIKYNDKNGEKKMPNGSRGSVAGRVVAPKMLRESRQSSIYVCTYLQLVFKKLFYVVHRTYLENENDEGRFFFGFGMRHIADPCHAMMRCPERIA